MIDPRSYGAVVMWFINGHAMVVDGGLTAGRRFSEAQDSWNTFRDLMGIPRKETPRPT